jgi:hypothetical protein
VDAVYLSGNDRASLWPHNYVGPLAEWKLAKIAQFWNIDEAANMTRPAKISRSKRIMWDDIEEGTVIS